MNINKKNFYIAALFGLLIGSAFTISAFTEPTTLPADTSSYPPINLSPVTQYHYGSLCFGDGTNKVDTSQCPVGSLAIKSNLLLDRLTVRQNANFVSDVTVDKRNIFAGALRVAQVSVDADPAKAQSYTTGAEKLYFPNGTTTNLISGNTCTTSGNVPCSSGTVLVKHNPSTGESVCRFINPVKNSGDLGKCSSFSYPTIALTLTTTTKDTAECLATLTYTSSATDSTLWELKENLNVNTWTDLGSGTTKNITVDLTKNTSYKIFELRGTTINKFNLKTTTTVDVNTASATYCQKW